MMKKSYRDIFDLQMTAHAKDWTPPERNALTALVSQAFEAFWKTARRDTLNLKGLRTAIQAIGKSRRVKATRVIGLTNLQFALQLARELDPAKED